MEKLDQEEKSLRASIERGEWKSAHSTRRELQRYIAYARNTLRKNRRINIRLSQNDLEALQTRAIHEGIPYQTLISSLLHKYVVGRLKAA
ncbi:MAG: antitoxin [Candidatus Omnitrophica bacterium]|nr:antitoxin [Candidatus Omnitrophota bacterium]